LSSNRADQPGRTRQPGQTRAPDRARQAIEQRSAAPLLWLHQLPAWLLPLLAVGLLVAGLAIGGLGGAIALAGLAVVLGWLAALSWPRLSAPGRLLRVMSVGCVLLLAVLRGMHS
jgi:hypothetical protein